MDFLWCHLFDQFAISLVPDKGLNHWLPLRELAEFLIPVRRLNGEDILIWISMVVTVFWCRRLHRPASWVALKWHFWHFRWDEASWMRLRCFRAKLTGATVSSVEPNEETEPFSPRVELRSSFAHQRKTTIPVPVFWSETITQLNASGRCANNQKTLVCTLINLLLTTAENRRAETGTLP